MRHNSFRIKFATGAFTLPIMLGLTAVLWMLPDLTDTRLAIGLGIVGLTTFLLAELNNRNALIRIRSRMVGATFLVLLLACPQLHRWSTGMIPMVCLAMSYFQLFATYQKARPEGNVFLGFLFLGVASWFYPPLLFCAVILYLCLLIPLRSLTWRTWFAGIFGLIVPYWCYTAWAIWYDKLPSAFRPFAEAFNFQPTDFSAVPQGVVIWLISIAFIAICSIFHFAYTAYNDKIRTRMYYYVIISIEVFILAIVFLQPQSYIAFSGLLCVNSAPLIAHHFALGKGRILDYWFILLLLLWSTLTLFNFFDLWTLL